VAWIVSYNEFYDIKRLNTELAGMLHSRGLAPTEHMETMSPTPLINPITVGRWHCLQKLGKGSFGHVLAGQHRDTKVLVYDQNHQIRQKDATPNTSRLRLRRCRLCNT
jgi:hypothetical protein